MVVASGRAITAFSDGSVMAYSTKDGAEQWPSVDLSADALAAETTEEELAEEPTDADGENSFVHAMANADGSDPDDAWAPADGDNDADPQRA